jgi:predicted transcriptional regulator
MNTLTIGVASLGDTQRRLSAAFPGKKQGARISFASEDLLWKTLTPKRWALLKLMAGQGAIALQAAGTRFSDIPQSIVLQRRHITGRCWDARRN